MYRKVESSIERSAVAWARDRGVLVVKLKIPEQSGYPDRMFFIPGGKPLLIEFKRPGGKPRKLQINIIEKLTRIGYNVHATDNIEDFKRLITQAVGAASVPKEID